MDPGLVLAKSAVFSWSYFSLECGSVAALLSSHVGRLHFYDDICEFYLMLVSKVLPAVVSSQ